MSDELENVVQEFPQEPVQEPAKVEAKPEEKTKDQEAKEKSLRDLRERAEAAERRARDLEQYVQQQQQPRQVRQEEDEDDIEIKDDDFIEGKHFKKYVKNLKKELINTKKQIAEFNQQTAVSTAEVRLKSQFNDFDSVVTKDNLERLATAKPSLYRTIMANQDIYDRGYVAYEMIKNAGFAEDYSQQDQRIEQNKAKPRSSSTAAPQASESPLSRAGDYDRRVLTEERKEQLRRQVEEAKRNR